MEIRIPHKDNAVFDSVIHTTLTLACASCGHEIKRECTLPDVDDKAIELHEEARGEEWVLIDGQPHCAGCSETDVSEKVAALTRELITSRRFIDKLVETAEPSTSFTSFTAFTKLGEMSLAEKDALAIELGKVLGAELSRE